jgi:hypothetical protein
VSRKIAGVILPCLVFINVLIPQEQAHAEVCPTYNLQSIFFEEYYGTRWDNRSGSIEINWTLNRTTIRDENIIRPFTESEQLWVRAAFASWDDALSTVSFKEVTNPATPQISIGLVPLNEPGAAGYWNATWFGNWRNNATIKIKESLIASNELSLKSKAPFVDSINFQKNWLIGIVQHELGNVLGLGDIKPDSGIVSIQNDPFSPNATTNPLRESDVGMMRQLYGESTCPSTFTEAYKAAIALQAKQEADAKVAAELKAKQEEEAKLAEALRVKQEADAKAAAELKAKQEAEDAKVAAELKAKQEAEAKAAADAAAQKLIQEDFNLVMSDYQKLMLRIYNLKIKYPRVSNLLGIEEKMLRLPIILGNDLTTAKYNIQSVNASLGVSEKVWEATQKTTITCVKGKLTKKVTAVKPKCPSGYKLKK